MSQAPKCSPHGWTVDTLHAHLTSRIDSLVVSVDERESRNIERLSALKETISFAMLSSEKALSKAETATDKRFESVNEFRDTLRDQAATFLTRTDYDSRHQSLVEKIEALTSRLLSEQSADQGKTKGLSTMGIIAIGIITSLSAITSAVTVVYNIFHK